jgi:hypothetical protein
VDVARCPQQTAHSLRACTQTQAQTEQATHTHTHTHTHHFKMRTTAQHSTAQHSTAAAAQSRAGQGRGRAVGSYPLQVVRVFGEAQSRAQNRVICAQRHKPTCTWHIALPLHCHCIAIATRNTSQYSTAKCKP